MPRAGDYCRAAYSLIHPKPGEAMISDSVMKRFGRGVDPCAGKVAAESPGRCPPHDRKSWGRLCTSVRAPLRFGPKKASKRVSRHDAVPGIRKHSSCHTQLRACAMDVSTATRTNTAISLRSAELRQKTSAPADGAQARRTETAQRSRIALSVPARRSAAFFITQKHSSLN